MFLLETIITLIIGIISGIFLSFIPGIHIYNVIGIIIWLITSFVPLNSNLSFLFIIGATVSFSIFGHITSTVISIPDEGAYFTMQPALKFLREGKCIISIIITGTGAIAGICSLILLGPFIVKYIPTINKILNPHYYWIIWAVTVFILFSELPPCSVCSYYDKRSLWRIFQQNLSGILTFAMAGILGIIAFNKNPFYTETNLIKLTPVFTGIFSIPAVVINLLSGEDIPKQYITIKTKELSEPSPDYLSAFLSGLIGGLFTSIIPGVTAVVAGMITGYMFKFQNSKTFLFAQGTARAVYYVTTFIFLVPSGNISAGISGAHLLSFLDSKSPENSYLYLCAICLSVLIIALSLPYVSKSIVRIVNAVGHKKISLFSLFFILLWIIIIYGLKGLSLLTISTMIGLMPFIYNSGCVNCIGVVLIPAALNAK